MLTFQDKLAVIASYPELSRKDVSLGRVNFQYEESRHEKKNVVYHLHPNGNGYVYAGLLTGYETDDKGYANIRDFSEEQLRALLEATIRSLSEEPDRPAPAASSKKRKPAKRQTWRNGEGHTLELRFEEDMWYLYAGLNLDMAFETYAEAEEYLVEEGFTQTDTKAT